MTNEEAIKHVENMKKGVFLFQPDELYDTIINALKTGHWIDTDEGFSPCKCSECESVEFKRSRYCPNCGAKMAERRLENDSDCNNNRR